jgi:hypothetical protein
VEDSRYRVLADIRLEPACGTIAARMRIETKYLAIEIEPELLTDEHLARVQKPITLATDYEKNRREGQKNPIKGERTEAEPDRKRRNRSGQ